MRKDVCKVLSAFIAFAFICTANVQIVNAAPVKPETAETAPIPGGYAPGATTNSTAVPEETGAEITNMPQTDQPVRQGYVNEPLDNPVPVLYSYELVGNDKIIPGEEFTLKFKVYNPAVVSKLGNIRIEVYQENGLINPIYGKTNDVYLGYLETLSYADGEITLLASKNINVEELPIILRLTYTDNYTTEKSQNLSAVLPVSTSGKLSVDSVDLPAAMYVGANNRLNVTYSNNGLSTINDLVLHIGGDKIEDSEVILGSIGSGSSVTSDIYVGFAEAGDQSLRLYFTYTDREGLSQQTDPLTYNFNVNDYTAEENMENGDDIYRIRRINIFMSVFVLFVSIAFLTIMWFRRNKTTKLVRKPGKGGKA